MDRQWAADADKQPDGWIWSRHMPGNNVQTHECMDLDKAKLMIQSNRLYKIYRDKQGTYS